MTRSMAVFVCAILLAVPGPDASAGDTEAEQIIDEAIRAHGGEEKLKALSGFTYKVRIVYENGTIWSWDYAVEPPHRYRSTATIGTGGKITSLMVIDGDRGWLRANGETTPYPQTFVDSYKKYTIRYLGPHEILRLRDRQKNPRCHISVAGECTIDGHQAVGLRMKLQDGPQQTWYFDKETGLLLKEESVTKRFEGEDTIITSVHSDYKTRDGLPMACKVTNYQDGKPSSTWEMHDFKVGTPDPSAFAKP